MVLSRYLVRTVAACAVLCCPFGVGRIDAAPILSAVYEPTTGNITLQATDGGQPAALSISTFQLLSPGLLLSGTTASIPSAASSFATVLNTSTSTLVSPPSVHAEIYATNFGGSTPLFTGTWSLGAVAAPGLSQVLIDSGFGTDPDVSPGGNSIPGSFLYQVQGDFEFQVGQITAVPEPSSLMLLASALAAGGAACWRRWRRSVTAG